MIDIILNDGTINFSPRNTQEEVIQNVRTICTTIKGTVPLDREFGIDPVIMDSPVSIARAKVSAQYIMAIRKYEPRVESVKVSFRDSPGQEVITVISIKMRE